MIKLAIFDLDGTLLNTIEDIAVSLNKSLKHNGLPTHSLETVLKMVGNGVDLLIQRAVNPYHDKFDDVKSFYLEDYNKNCGINTKPYPGINAMIKELKNMNIKIAVLSNKPHKDTVTVMETYFNGVFDYVIGKKDCNRIKPYSDGVIEVMNTLDIKNNNNVVYIGDSEVDVQTGKNALLKTIAVTWGFRTKEQLEGADYIVDKASDIIDIIKGVNNG